MSTERLEELGVPRRAFLMKGAAALAAPLIVSFGIDAIAEGTAYGGQSKPNQCFPNQAFANQLLFYGSPLDRILSQLFEGLAGKVTGMGIREMNPVAALAVEACVYEAGGEPLEAYALWGQFIALVKSLKHLPPQIAESLIAEGERAQQELDCN